jgi:SNF2 family DNA or RNA helicase
MTFRGTLRPYQEEAVEGMLHQGQMLLAMIMGAGKTPTTLAAVEALHEDGEVDRCLVIVPASLKYQWRDEIKKFTDATAVVIDGPKAGRTGQWRSSHSARYVIINPETLMNDKDQIGAYQCVVVDESTMLKNRGTKRSKLVKRIGRAAPYRFALTGQPIENRPEELFSIMEFVNKDVLGDFTTFDRTFIVRDNWGKPKRYRNLDRLHVRMEPYLVRKTREDIADQLPAVIHQFLPIKFDRPGAAAYEQIAADLLSELSRAISQSGGRKFDLFSFYGGKDGNEAQGQVMARLTVLRMLCDNPDLVRISASKYLDTTTKAGSQFAADVVAAGWLDHVRSAPKLEACVDYVDEVISEDPTNKIVVFSFFKENLRLIKAATSKICDSVIFDGGMTASEKDAAKQKFAKDKNCRLFLSSDAGGYGVDLPMANYLLSYDLPWSSGRLEQREARIIRLSSEFEHVTVSTFVMADSIEEWQYEKVTSKRSVNEAFIDGKHVDDDGSMELSLDSLSNFLRTRRP